MEKILKIFFVVWVLSFLAGFTFHYSGNERANIHLNKHIKPEILIDSGLAIGFYCGNSVTRYIVDDDGFKSIHSGSITSNIRNGYSYINTSTVLATTGVANIIVSSLVGSDLLISSANSRSSTLILMAFSTIIGTGTGITVGMGVADSMPISCEEMEDAFKESARRISQNVFSEYYSGKIVNYFSDTGNSYYKIFCDNRSTKRRGPIKKGRENTFNSAHIKRIICSDDDWSEVTTADISDKVAIRIKAAIDYEIMLYGTSEIQNQITDLMDLASNEENIDNRTVSSTDINEFINHNKSDVLAFVVSNYNKVNMRKVGDTSIFFSFSICFFAVMIVLWIVLKHEAEHEDEFKNNTNDDTE